MAETIEKKIQTEVRKREKTISKDADYKRLLDYYFEMKKLGISRKQEYDLPQMDTVGISYYQSEQVS